MLDIDGQVQQQHSGHYGKDWWHIQQVEQPRSLGLRIQRDADSPGGEHQEQPQAVEHHQRDISGQRFSRLRRCRRRGDRNSQATIRVRIPMNAVSRMAGS